MADVLLEIHPSDGCSFGKDDKTTFFGHKMLLAMTSPFFKTMFYEKHWSNSISQSYIKPQCIQESLEPTASSTPSLKSKAIAKKKSQSTSTTIYQHFNQSKNIKKFCFEDEEGTPTKRKPKNVTQVVKVKESKRAKLKRVKKSQPAEKVVVQIQTPEQEERAKI